MELRREHIEAFQKAYKLDIGEDLSYSEAFEMAHRLVNIFLILEKAAQKRARKHQDVDDEEDDQRLESCPVGALTKRDDAVA